MGSTLTIQVSSCYAFGLIGETLGRVSKLVLPEQANSQAIYFLEPMLQSNGTPLFQSGPKGFSFLFPQYFL